MTNAEAWTLIQTHMADLANPNEPWVPVRSLTARAPGGNDWSIYTGEIDSAVLDGRLLHRPPTTRSSLGSVRLPPTGP